MAKQMCVAVAIDDFVDGGLAGYFSEYKYKARWPRGEERTIPMSLVERVRNSGGVIEVLHLVIPKPTKAKKSE